MELMNYGYLIYMLRALNTFYQSGIPNSQLIQQYSFKKTKPLHHLYCSKKRRENTISFLYNNSEIEHISLCPKLSCIVV